MIVIVILLILLLAFHCFPKHLVGKVQVLEELNSKDSRLADVRLALVTSSCSKSALVNPVHFLLDEGEGQPT